MYYDILSVLYNTCECSYFHYLRQLIAVEFISCLHFGCNADFDFDTMTGEKRHWITVEVYVR